MIPLFKVKLPPARVLMPALKKVLYSGYIGQGPKVEEFEHELEKLVGPHVVALNSGTSAIRLALRLADVGHGDNVISTPMTCTATNTPILEQGADILWEDVEHNTGNINARLPKSFKRANLRTRAILCVHWGGNPCDLQRLNELADSVGISVIEDAAHALGAVYQGKTIGHHSRFVCFSFQAIKHLTTVDGGALVCRRKEDYERAKLLRWYGINRETPSKDLRCEVDIREYGYKYHMNDVTATIGLCQLAGLHNVIDAHRGNALYLQEAAVDMGARAVPVGEPREGTLSSCWMLTLLVKDRHKFQEIMKKQGVMTSQVHVRNDIHTAFEKFKVGGLHDLDFFANHQVSIPCGWWLTKKDLATIKSALWKALKK